MVFTSSKLILPLLVFSLPPENKESFCFYQAETDSWSPSAFFLMLLKVERSFENSRALPGEL